MPLTPIPNGVCVRSVDLAFDSSAKVIFATVSSGGRLYVKGPSGLDGDAMLLREWFGSSLADAFGLQTLNYSLMAEPVNPLDGHIPLADGSQLRTDMAFATRVEPGLAWEGGSEALLLVGNRSDFARMVVFDTWVRNVDRYCPRSDGSYHSNLGNVFLSTDKSRATKPQLLAVDHTHILFGNHEFPMGDQRLLPLSPVELPIVRSGGAIIFAA